MTAVENKIPNNSSLVKKTDYNTKISEIEKNVTNRNHDKYITTPEFKTFAAEIFAARLAQAKLVTKTDFDTKLVSLNRKVNSNKTKHVLVQNELKKLQTFHSSYFRCKHYFENGGTQNYLVLYPMNRYFQKINNTCHISDWKYKGLFDELLSLLPHLIIVLLQH